MGATKYHVYLDWQDFTVQAAPCGSMLPWKYNALTESLWQIEAENKDDALRRSVTDGHVAKVIEKTEGSLTREKEYITRCGNNPYNPTIGTAREVVMQMETKLAHFKELQEIYSPPVVKLPVEEHVPALVRSKLQSA